MGYEEIKSAFDKREQELLDSYSPEVKDFLNKALIYSSFNIQFTEVGKKLYFFLENTGNKPSQFFREHKDDFKGWINEDRLEDFYTSIDDVIYFQNRLGIYRRCLRDK